MFSMHRKRLARKHGGPGSANGRPRPNAGLLYRADRERSLGSVVKGMG